MAEDNVNIQMRLISVSEVSFMMSPGKIGDDVNPDAVQIGFSTQIQPDVENDTFNLFSVLVMNLTETLCLSVCTNSNLK